MEIVAEIEDNNGMVLGPVATLDAGIAALQEQRPDACIANINLGREKVYDLADLLIDRSSSPAASRGLPSRIGSTTFRCTPSPSTWWKRLPP